MPLVEGVDASDSGQFGAAFRFPVDKLDTEFGFYGMNIHSRLPIISGRLGHASDEIPEPLRSALIAQGIIGFDHQARRGAVALLEC